jgi:uncharacterized protein (TIGR02996 family)
MPNLPFGDEEKVFIRAVLTNPAELTAWLVYADWLDEHDNPTRAEFLRLTVRHAQLHNTDLEWYTVAARLRELRSALDPNWVAVFDRPKIENCEPALRVQCPRQWENLKGTDDPTVRHCGACAAKVYYCHTVAEAREHVRQGHCVAVQLSAPRAPDDLKGSPAEEAGELLLKLVEASRSPESEPVGSGSAPPPRRPWWKFW